MDRKASLSYCLQRGKFEWTEVACGGTVEGERAGAIEICEWWREREQVLEDDVEVWVVVEDFILRAQVGSTARAGLSSPRMAGLVEGMLVRVVPSERWARYSPARSKNFANGERLRQWGLWCRGSEHARDAARQIALHIAVMREDLA